MIIVHFLRLIRIQNLIIIAVIQYFIKWFIVTPMLMAFPIEVENKIYFFELESQFNDLYFALMVAATVLTAAAGNVINDYFDRKTDMLNKPESVIVGKHINRRAAMTIHGVFSTIAILIGFYISWKIKLWQLSMIFILTTGLLWYYSVLYKKQLIIGNLIVALLSALVPILVALYEIPPLNTFYRELILKYNVSFLEIFYWALTFGIFAFLTSFSREIVKDIEDLEGDNAYGCNTIPIAWGITNAKIIAISLNIITIGILAYIYLQHHDNNKTLLYFSVISLLIILYNIFLFKAQRKKDYRFVSIFMKIVMILGITYAPYFHYIVIPSLTQQ